MVEVNNSNKLQQANIHEPIHQLFLAARKKDPNSITVGSKRIFSHSYRSDSTGSTLAALIAGNIPASNPITPNTPTVTNTAS